MSVSSATIRLESLPLIRQGKVRDCYQLGDNLLFVASDRISAFDVILPSAIPGKGAILNQLSGFWFKKTESIVPNHLLAIGLPASVETENRAWFDARSTVARRADRIDFECVVRGYLAGSGWAEYKRTGAIAGHALPADLPQAAKLPEPIFTPARKNDTGHDENISVKTLGESLGTELAGKLEQISKDLYSAASHYAERRGLILADTKFEFGWIDGEFRLIDEILTPDSSRYWDLENYEPGQEQLSFDKQFVRNWLDSIGWDHEPPAPSLPLDVIEGTQQRYSEAFERLTGQPPIY